jgi:hypothetical protein
MYLFMLIYFVKVIIVIFFVEHCKKIIYPNLFMYCFMQFLSIFNLRYGFLVE